WPWESRLRICSVSPPLMMFCIWVIAVRASSLDNTRTMPAPSPSVATSLVAFGAAGAGAPSGETAASMAHSALGGDAGVISGYRLLEGGGLDELGVAVVDQPAPRDRDRDRRVPWQGNCQQATVVVDIRAQQDPGPGPAHSLGPVPV